MSYSGNNSADVGEDIYNQAESARESGLTREVPRAPKVIGYVAPMADPRLVSYDRLEARSKKPLAWEVTRDDRMSAVEAGATMRKLYDLFGLRGEQPVVLDAFHDAVYLAHTLNSGSVLQPGRAKIILSGNSMDLYKVVEYLGSDLRRFYRAYADEVRNCNKRILSAATDPTDLVAMEKAAWIRQSAANRGLSRYPDLAHDSADACLSLTDAEHSALTSSKTSIFSTGTNMADRNRVRPVQSGSPGVGSMFVNPSAQVALGDQ